MPRPTAGRTPAETSPRGVIAVMGPNMMKGAAADRAVHAVGSAGSTQGRQITSQTTGASGPKVQ